MDLFRIAVRVAAGPGFAPEWQDIMTAAQGIQTKFGESLKQFVGETYPDKRMLSRIFDDLTSAINADWYDLRYGPGSAKKNRIFETPFFFVSQSKTPSSDPTIKSYMDAIIEAAKTLPDLRGLPPKDTEYWTKGT